MKKIVLFLLFLPLFGIAQEKKWYKITDNDVIIMSLQVVSGVADGFNQAIIHYNYGKGNPFWDNKISWTNKWKDGKPENGEKFFGSSTVFVMFTDGFHLTRFFDRASSMICIGISFSEFKDYSKKDIWKVIAKKVILSYVVNRSAFTITYKSL